MTSRSCRICLPRLILPNPSRQSSWHGHRHASSLSPPEIDAKWQKIWERQGQLSAASSTKGENAYVLPMFAYPSGALHIGHLRVYTISDVIARYKRMRGYNVLHPTGWDAFGLPAENAAIERGIDPAVWTDQNIRKMRQTLKSMNTHFNWDAEISTCSPSFYKHTQRLFLMLYEQGLAYRAEARVNWDPVDKTVLANEQVDSQGRSWRSGAVVEQIDLKQWFFGITKYAHALNSALDELGQHDQWPERVLTQQRHWLGCSRGAKIRFRLTGAAGSCNSALKEPSDEPTQDAIVTVFTTRPDTVYGVKYLALSTSHPLVLECAKDFPALQVFLKETATSTAESKNGYVLPLTAYSEISDGPGPLPVYVAPYVLENYGEGAVMGVPAHDNRDLAFWKQHRPNEKIPLVVQALDSRLEKLLVDPSELLEAQTLPGVLTSRCGTYAGMTSEAFIEKMCKTSSGSIVEHTTWRLRDWLVSRQRYWGTPIPIVHCKHCGTVPVPQEELPIVLPKLDSSAIGRRGNPLEHALDWVNCKCPSCSRPAKRETDTMDTFVDSSWYYARFPDSTNEDDFLSKEMAAAMLPVDVYVGGVEHAILHLLYARFIYKFLADQGIAPRTIASSPLQGNVPRGIEQEPFLRLIAQGMVHGKTFSDPQTGRFLLPHELQQNGDETIMTASGLKPNVTWEKMSKSKHNGVDPDICISKYGADTARAHILFAAPVSEILQWDEQKIVGIQRWFGRVRRVIDKVEAPTQARGEWSITAEDLSGDKSKSGKPAVSAIEADVLLLTHETVRRVTHTFEKDIYSLNTAISDLIKLTNALDDVDVSQIRPKNYQLMVVALLQMLAPVAPAFAEQCWEDMGARLNEGSSILQAGTWPKPFLTPEAHGALNDLLTNVLCAVQINGKLRFTAMVPRTEEKDMAKVPQEQVDRILGAILATEQATTWFGERYPWAERKKVIVVKGGKLVNIVF